ncbi:MAG: exonuclease V subunit gamma, partial [Bacteroidetes bacterium]|nr:exonuclease V subunit gamma [Bacteroidota bacterium]
MIEKRERKNMALELYASSALAKLCDRLVNDLKREQAGVFDPIWIITQTDGMDGWLRERMAR